MMKIKPYPGKIAVIRNLDGIEKEVTMNYESSWQECLQLWGSQNNHNHHHYGNGHYPFTKTFDVLPVNQKEVIDTSNFTPVAHNGCGGVAANSYVTDLSMAGSASLSNGNGTVPSHSFNYYDNFVNNSAASDAMAQLDASRSHGRQRCCPQMLDENQAISTATAACIPVASTAEMQSQMQNGVMYAPVTVTPAVASVPAAPNIPAPAPPVVSKVVSANSNGAEYAQYQRPEMTNGWTNAQHIIIDSNSPCAMIKAASSGACNDTGALTNGEHHQYGAYNQNSRKIYRTPTMLEKSVGMPYLCTDMTFSGEPATTPFITELGSNKVPTTHSDNGFLIPRPKLIVPVHTYGSRKRRTGNILHSKRRGSDSEPCGSSSTTAESKKHHTSCPGTDRNFKIYSTATVLILYISFRQIM